MGMKTFEEFQKELEMAHWCEKCDGKIVCISVDPSGIKRCAYCNSIVVYPEPTREEFVAWMEEASKMDGIKEFVRIARERLL